MKLREAQDVAQQQVNALTGMLSCKMDKVCHRLVGARQRTPRGLPRRAFILRNCVVSPQVLQLGQAWTPCCLDVTRSS